MNKDEYFTKTKFVVKLGLSLHDCGATSHRIERHLIQVCELLGINGEFLPSQTSFTFVFWEDDPTDQHIFIKRVEPSGGNLGLLTRLDTLIEKFGSKQLTFDEMNERLEKTLTQAPIYSKCVQSLAWAASSFAFSTLLSRSSYDAIVSAVASFIIFYLLEICAKYTRFNFLSEIIATGCSAIIIAFVSASGIPLNIPFCILSSVIAMIPGLAITVALSEIAHRDLNSGTARFVDASMSLIKLHLGAIIGLGISSFILSNIGLHTFHNIQNIPEWVIWPAVFILGSSITVAFNIHPKFIFWCILSSYIAFTASFLVTEQFNQPTGILFGACAVGVYSNVFANLFNRPASLVLTTGIIFLVPGSKTYMILNAWVTGEQMSSNTPNVTQVFLIFISLIGGLLLSNAILPTKKSL